jgi:hypothetical protein
MKFNFKLYMSLLKMFAKTLKKLELTQLKGIFQRNMNKISIIFRLQTVNLIQFEFKHQKIYMMKYRECLTLFIKINFKI